MKFSQLSVLLALGASVALKGYSADRVATNVLASSAIMAATNPIPNAPAVLPGQGLAQHDFFYAGESKDERMYIVRNGGIVWSYTNYIINVVGITRAAAPFFAPTTNRLTCQLTRRTAAKKGRSRAFISSVRTGSRAASAWRLATNFPITNLKRITT